MINPIIETYRPMTPEILFLKGKLKVFLLLMMVLWIAPVGRAQNPATITEPGVSVKSLFISDEAVQLALKFDIRKFIRDKFEDVYMPATLTYLNDDGIPVSDSILIKARGNSRKKICYFPPIKLKISNSSFQEALPGKVKSLKLVTHCNNSKKSDQYLLREYLVYRLYNLFTDLSYRVQLVNMNYVDTESRVQTMCRSAFLIEDGDALAERTACVEIENDNLGMKHIDKQSLMLFSMFQYMIGNVDWKTGDLHNISLFKSYDFKFDKPFVVPYDFDHSGFVNAGYAVNVRNPDITSVKTRVFTGPCFTENEYQSVILEFVQQKGKIYQMIDDFNLLDKKSKKELTSYIDAFYKIIEKPGFYQKYIATNCTLLGD